MGLCFPLVSTICHPETAQATLSDLCLILSSVNKLLSLSDNEFMSMIMMMTMVMMVLAVVGSVMLLLGTVVMVVVITL